LRLQLQPKVSHLVLEHWVLLHQQRRLHAVQVLHFIFQEPGQALRSVVKEHLEGVPVTLVTLPRLMQRAQQGLSKGLTNLRHKNLLPAEQIASGLLGEISGVPAWQGQLKPDLIVVTAFLPGRPVRMGFAFSVHNLMVAAALLTSWLVTVKSFEVVWVKGGMGDFKDLTLTEVCACWF